VRCCACDALLNDYDVTVKSEVTKEYLDMCGHCRASISDLVDIPDDIIDDTDEIDQDVLDLGDDSVYD
jgi:hypothetical protein